MSNDRAWGFRTRAVHAGAVPDAATGARAVPIYQSTSFVFSDTTDAASLGMLVRDGGLLVMVPTADQSASVAPRARRFRSLAVAHHERPFAHSWNEAVLQWQRTGSLPTSSSPAHS